MPAARHWSRSSFPRPRRQGDDGQMAPGRPARAPGSPARPGSRRVPACGRPGAGGRSPLLPRDPAPPGHWSPRRTRWPCLPSSRSRCRVLNSLSSATRMRSGAAARAGAAASSGHGGWPGDDRLRGVWLPPEPRREGEGAAPARLALHADRPAHQADQPRGDGQAQPGAAVLSRGGVVRLLEGPEDPLLPVRRDADAGVLTTKRRTASPSDAGPSAASTRTTTSPCLVNLIALPIRLSSTCRSRPASPTRASGTSGCTSQASSSPLARARTLRVRRASPSVARSEKSAGSSSSLPASIFSKSSRSSTRPRRLSAADLAVSRHCRWSSVSGRVEDQLGHAEDGAEGGADLVADVGQELVLGPVRRLGRLLGLPQLRLQPLAIGDVLDDRDGVGGRSRLVALERDRHLHPDRRAVLADVALLQREAGDLAPPEPGIQLPVHGQVLGVRDLLGRSSRATLRGCSRRCRRTCR